MAKIIIDINEDNQYYFLIKKDNNYLLGTSCKFDRRNYCFETVDFFRVFASEPIYWSFHKDDNGFNFACFKSESECIVTTKKYRSMQDLNKCLNFIKTNISVITQALSTTIRNPKFHQHEA